MTKFPLKLTICIIISIMMCFNLSARGTWRHEQQTAISKISTESLFHDIGFLSDTLCSGRATGTMGNTEAAFWIMRKFQNAGLISMNGSYGSHFTTPTGANAHNVIGMIPGALTEPKDSYIIIGAHFDHLGKLNGQVYPGADSNASGTVALTSLAEIFGAMKSMGRVYDCNIIFAAFDAKEMDMSGSEALWKLIDYGILKDPITGETVSKDKIILMANIDQIGSSLSPIRKDRKDYMIMLGNDSLHKSRRLKLEACNMLYDINLDLCLSYYGSKTFTDVFYRLSDQRIFVDNRIPAVLFTSGITMNTNKTRDTAESLDMEVLHKRIRLIYHWIEAMMQIK